MKFLYKSLFSVILCILSLTITIDSKALTNNPVNVTLKEIADSDIGANFELHFKIPEGWIVYSHEAGDIGFPIDLDFSKSKNLKNQRVYWPDPKPKVEKIDGVEFKYSAYSGSLKIPLKIYPLNNSLPVELDLKLKFGACEKVCISQEFAFNRSFIAGEFPISSDNEELNTKFEYSLLMIFVFAIIGGLILNFMPCVLPVVTLKLLNIVKYTQYDKSGAKLHLLATSFGILITFLLLSIVTIILKSIGLNFGWGFQFQEPSFLIFLSIILTIFASNLWGDFELRLPGWFNNILNKPSNSEDNSLTNSIASGFFATFLATPCTAPFLSISIAFALTQSAPIIILTYMFVGLGMSLPYFLLAIFPRTLNLLPKPGEWMLHLKKLFAGFLIITLIWLLYVLYFQISKIAIIVLVLFLSALRLILKQKIKNKIIGTSIFITLCAFTYLAPMNISTSDPTYKNDESWEQFNHESLISYINEGKIVLVDISAEWGLTCKSNKLFVLGNKEVIKFLKENNVVLMHGDYTNKSEIIYQYLKSHNRYGIPLNVIYGPNNSDGIVLPELLSKNILIKNVEKVAN